MDSQALTDLGFVLLFVLAGGAFAAAGTALISIRESQLATLAERRPRRWAKVQKLVAAPDRVLTTVQVGVTLAGFIAAGFGAAQIAPVLVRPLGSAGLSSGAAAVAAFSVVTLLIAYLFLVLGDWVPKRIARQRAESTAVLVAGSVDLIAGLLRPFVWLLTVSADVVARLVGGDPRSDRGEITTEELRGMVASHEQFTEAERELIDDVIEAGQRELREVMIPRTEVEFLRHDMPVFKAMELVAAQPYSRYPVIGDSPDDVLGFVHVRDLLAPALSQRGIRLDDIVREVVRLPGSKSVLPALSELRQSGVHLAIVVDEYGGTDGIVTLEDLVEEVIGEIRDEYDAAAVISGPREVAGLTNLEDFAEATGVELLEGPYETVAGWLMARLGRIPEMGDTVDHAGHRIEVVALDGRRVDRVRVELHQPG